MNIVSQEHCQSMYASIVKNGKSSKESESFPVKKKIKDMSPEEKREYNRT